MSKSCSCLILIYLGAKHAGNVFHEIFKSTKMSSECCKIFSSACFSNAKVNFVDAKLETGGVLTGTQTTDVMLCT